MTLLKILELYGGGPGSGCQGDNCGRPSVGGLSDRARRALETYVPVTAAKYALAKRNERSVAKVLNGVTTADNSPFDVLIDGKIGVEVKTIIEGRHDKVTIHPESMQEKKDEVKRLKLKSVYTVVADHRGLLQKWYVREGLGSFRLGTLKLMNKISDLKTEVL